MVKLECINSDILILTFTIFTGCRDMKETKILDFKESDVETVELYRFNTPTEAKCMIVTEN